MPLPSGAKLGTYEVLSAIGAGGMGKAYQAHDSKLGRDVAIKFLPETFAHNPEKLSRFQRESKLLASRSQAATMQGVLLSTASYMNPEKARGRAVDERTDIWAFGCVLYVLLTGEQTFHGEDITEIQASVVKSEPEWTALPAKILSTIPTLLSSCPRKDKRQRLAGATGLRIESEDVIAAPKSRGPAGLQPQFWVSPVSLDRPPEDHKCN